jgi:hypothetical protein
MQDSVKFQKIKSKKNWDINKRFINCRYCGLVIVYTFRTPPPDNIFHSTQAQVFPVRNL